MGSEVAEPGETLGLGTASGVSVLRERDGDMERAWRQERPEGALRPLC